MSISSAAAGLSRTFEFDGKIYELHPLTYGHMARIATWLEDRAREAIYRTAASGSVSPEFIKGLQAAFIEGVAAGKYEVGGSVFREADATGLLSRLTVQLMLEPHPQAEELSYRIMGDTQVWPKVQELCAEINRDPLAYRLRMLPKA